MNFFQRLAYYIFGITLGSIFVFFFFGGKNTSCNYFPNDRVLNDIRTKEINWSKKALHTKSNYQLDSSKLNSLFYRGSVDFKLSQTKLDSCKIYVINGTEETEDFIFTIQNCAKQATVLNVEKK